MHYKRGCRIVSPCCNIAYPCRICHDDAQNHVLNRKEIAVIECLRCGPDSRQMASSNCSTCGVRFSQYYCDICKLWDDEGFKKNIYHCDKCGICRIGPQENYFHCDKCDGCISISLLDNHVCVEGNLKNSCPVCLEDMFSSRESVNIFKCGHCMHAHCQSLLYTSETVSILRCPICLKTTIDNPSTMWTRMDSTVAGFSSPDVKATIRCNDCNKVSVDVALNIVAMKCSHCGGYNTCRE